MEKYPVSPHNKLIELAMMFNGVKEQGQNQGVLVEMFQRAVDGVARQEPYCMAFVQWLCDQVDLEIRLTFPSWPGHRLYRTEGCLHCWNMSPRSIKGMLPRPGMIVIWQQWKIIKDSAGRVKNEMPLSTGHCGVIVNGISQDVVETIEANTSGNITNQAGQIVREGDGIQLKRRNLDTEVGIMRFKGILDPWGF